jgi:aryl-alcohol dehydrogenase
MSEIAMQIEAAIARAQGTSLSLETVGIEEPRDNEILVKVVATGACHTDIIVRDGMLPTPLPVGLGHEGGRHCRESRPRRLEGEGRG